MLTATKSDSSLTLKLPCILMHQLTATALAASETVAFERVLRSWNKRLSRLTWFSTMLWAYYGALSGSLVRFSRSTFRVSS